jgi:GTP diphosphokinase / guanosine-3',5'-bis(diphosphate) 3'-diphosphatase
LNEIPLITADASSGAGAKVEGGMALGLFLKAVTFAARKHQDQRRKGRRHRPYINHLLQVAEILWEIGGVRDVEILIAAVLHDTLEDTKTTTEELEAAFGPRVLALVQAMTDDKSLPKQARKALQVTHAPHLSPAAKLIKLADKIHNVYELDHVPPVGWSRDRILAYVDWADKVVDGLRGVNGAMDTAYDNAARSVRRSMMTRNSDSDGQVDR